MKIIIYIILLSGLFIPDIKAQDAAVNGGNLQIFCGGSMAFFGNFTNNGTITDAGTAVYFNGSGAQLINSSVSTTFNNFIVNNSAGVAITSGALNIGNNINFVNGALHSSASGLLIINNNATATGASSSSYTDGPVKKIGNNAFEFPTGKSGNFQPVYMSAPADVNDAFTAEYFSADPRSTFGTNYDVGINHISGLEYWNLSQNNGTSNVNIRLGWNSGSGAVTNLSDLLVTGWDGTIWKSLGNGGTTGNTTAGTVISASPATFYGNFTLASTLSSNPLPVTLLSFNAILKNNWTYLNWETVSEINNDYFEIQKSADGRNFDFLTRVKGCGTCNKVERYNCIDPSPFAGITYYRLKQVDYNGKFTYSNIVTVNLPAWSQEEISIFPNPVCKNSVIKIKGLDDLEAILTLCDITGKILYSHRLGTDGQSGDINIPESIKQQPGIYLLNISRKNIVKTFRLVIS